MYIGVGAGFASRQECLKMGELELPNEVWRCAPEGDVAWWSQKIRPLQRSPDLRPTAFPLTKFLPLNLPLHVTLMLLDAVS